MGLAASMPRSFINGDSSVQMKNRIRWAAHADLFRQGVESAMNITSIETVALAGDEKVGGNCSSFSAAPAPDNAVVDTRQCTEIPEKRMCQSMRR
jgi:hypothetical protein